MKRVHSVIQTVEQSEQTLQKIIRLQATPKSPVQKLQIKSLLDPYLMIIKKNDAFEQVMLGRSIGNVNGNIAISSPVETAVVPSSHCNSKELLELLIKIADELILDDVDLFEIRDNINTLMQLFEQETQSDTPVRVKLLDLIADMVVRETPEDQLIIIVDQLISLLKLEKKQKVLSQGLRALYHIGKRHYDRLPLTHSTKIAHFGQERLKSESPQTHKSAMLLIGTFASRIEAERHYIGLLAHYVDSTDSGVRAQALRSILKLGERGARLSTDLYQRAIYAMKDDYECVRKEALRLVYTLGKRHPEHMLIPERHTEEIRLIDAAFSKVCEALCDLSMHIRVQAAEHLGGMTHVGSQFLHQTLDKKLMSNLRRKKSAHERGALLVSSGDWSAGKRWGDDAPQEQLESSSISLIASGACGALVHGLEDEFLEVRTAAVDSMCKLALSHPDFAVTCLDFLVDMFNDEIEDVRLKAIYSLTTIARHIVLREDQLEIMLSSLEDYSTEVREGLHLMLGACRVTTQSCLLMVVQKLLDVLAKYPQDRESAYACMRKIGQKHSHLCMAVTTHLLHDHPFFETPERDVEDPTYLCILILLFNAAQYLVPIISLFPKTTLKHYAYLRDSLPHLVPQLPIDCASSLKRINDLKGVSSSTEYLNMILSQIQEIFEHIGESGDLLKTAKKNLQRLGEIDADMYGTTKFLETFLATQIQIEQLQRCISAQRNRIPLKDTLSQLIKNCLKLQHIFSGLTYEDILQVKQLSLRACALQLVLIVRDRSQSALGPCQMLLQIANDISSYLNKNQEKHSDSFTVSLLAQLSNITDPKPGRVFRDILPLVQNARPLPLPPANEKIRVCIVNIIEPRPLQSQDNAIKVTAGLIAAVPFVAEIDNLRDSQKPDMRIKIKYPDQNVHTVVPKLSDFKSILTEQGEHETNIRLRTTILISHSVWTESSSVEITLCLAVRPGNDLELSKPAKILFAPKPVRRGI